MTLSIATNFEAAQAAYENAQGVECEWWEWIASPAGCIIIDALNDEEDLRIQRDAWGSGLNYMQSLNEQYKIAIGALELTTNVCNCEYYDSNGNFLGSNTQTFTNPNDCYTNTGHNGQNIICSNPITRIEHPSDGVVLASSAGDMPGGIVRPGLDREMKKTSHQQMRNNSELEVKLTNLFGGGVDNHFIILERQ